MKFKERSFYFSIMRKDALFYLAMAVYILFYAAKLFDLILPTDEESALFQVCWLTSLMIGAVLIRTKRIGAWLNDYWVFGKPDPLVIEQISPDILTVATMQDLPGTGKVGMVYMTMDNGKIWMWDNTRYVEVRPSF